MGSRRRVWVTVRRAAVDTSRVVGTAGTMRTVGAMGAAGVAIAILAAGCSYSPNPSSVPSHLKTVAIPMFENRTTEPSLEQEVTQAVVDRFVKDNHLRVVSEGDADALITGAVSGYR